MARSGPSRPLLQFPGLAPIVGVLPACQAPGPGPREGGAAGKLAHCPGGASLGRRPGAAGRRGEQRAHSPLAQPVASPGRWRKPPGLRRGQAQAGPPNHGLLFPSGCWRRKPAEQLPHSQLRVWRWRSEVLLRSPLRSPSISRASRCCAQAGASLESRDRPPFQARPPPPAPRPFPPLSHLRPGRAFPPARLPLSLRGHPLPSPGPALPKAQHGVSASHGATHGLGPEAGAADSRRVPHPADPGVRPLQPAILERPRRPGGKRARAR